MLTVEVLAHLPCIGCAAGYHSFPGPWSICSGATEEAEISALSWLSSLLGSPETTLGP